MSGVRNSGIKVDKRRTLPLQFANGMVEFQRVIIWVVMAKSVFCMLIEVLTVDEAHRIKRFCTLNCHFLGPKIENPEGGLSAKSNGGLVKILYT